MAGWDEKFNHLKPKVIPVVVFPDGSAINDSTFVIRRIETELGVGPDRPALPRDPVGGAAGGVVVQCTRGHDAHNAACGGSAKLGGNWVLARPRTASIVDGCSVPRAHPPAAQGLRFIASLLEDFADEWLTKCMYGFRWNTERGVVMETSILAPFAQMAHWQL